MIGRAQFSTTLDRKPNFLERSTPEGALNARRSAKKKDAMLEQPMGPEVLLCFIPQPKAPSEPVDTHFDGTSC